GIDEVRRPGGVRPVPRRAGGRQAAAPRQLRMRLARASALVALILAVGVSAAAASSPHATQPVLVSRCQNDTGNEEPVQAVDGRYVYEAWIGCGGWTIGFARSTDGGRRFGP